MTTISHEPSAPASRPAWLDARDMWASLAIVAIWVAVLFAAVFAPDLRAIANDGDSTTIPSGVIVSFFALFATISVAKYVFRRPS